MNKDSFNLGDLPTKINSAKSFLVVLPRNLTVDNVAAALALFLSLKKKKARVKVGSPSQVTVELNRLFGVDKITTETGSKNLIISFDYIEDSIEKVSYNVANNKFNLVVQPKDGFEPLDSKKVEYNYSGADADVIFIIGAQKLEDLGLIYEQDKKVFNKAETVNIDVNPTNTKFGKTNLVLPGQTATSQIVAKVIKKLNLPVDQDIATNLIAGLESVTSSFQNRTTADIFETVAWALRQGGKQKHLQIQAVQPPKPPFVQSLQQPMPQPPFQKPNSARVSPGEPNMPPPPVFATPQPSQAQATQTPPPPFVQQANDSQTTGDSKPQEEKPPTPDWLKPKIFRGGIHKG